MTVTVVGGFGDSGSPEVGHESGGGIRVDLTCVGDVAALLQPEGEAVTEDFVLLQGAGTAVGTFRTAFEGRPDFGKIEPGAVDQFFRLCHLDHQFGFRLDGGDLPDSGEELGGGFVGSRFLRNDLIYAIGIFRGQNFLFAFAANWIGIHQDVAPALEIDAAGVVAASLVFFDSAHVTFLESHWFSPVTTRRKDIPIPVQLQPICN